MGCELKYVKPRPALVTYRYREFRRLDFETFKRSLNKSQSFCSPQLDPDSAVSQLTADLIVVCDKHLKHEQEG